MEEGSRGRRKRGGLEEEAEEENTDEEDKDKDKDKEEEVEKLRTSTTGYPAHQPRGRRGPSSS